MLGKLLRASLVVFLISAAAALVAGCAGIAQSPAGTPAIRAGGAHRASSWMLPQAKSGDLVYTTDDAGEDVYVYGYPKGQLVGTLSGFAAVQGLCSDKHGNVFVPDADAEDVVEYAHGGTTPIATLSDAGNEPNGCAVDPATGNLAVAGGDLGNANVAIYANASGSPTVYPDGDDSLYWCTYDSNSNLFMSPWNDTGGTVVELPKGSENLKNIYVDQQMNPGGAIAWDGKHLVLGNPLEEPRGPSTVVQLAISGSKATIVRSITLDGGKTARKSRNPRIGNQFWLLGNTILDVTKAEVGTWSYPRGGHAVRFMGAYSGMGLTVSVAP